MDPLVKALNAFSFGPATQKPSKDNGRARRGGGRGRGGTDGVDPESGHYPLQKFTFRVKATDVDGDEPTYCRVAVERDGSAWRTFNMRRGPGTPQTGIAYWFARKLAPGEYGYRFEVGDKYGSGTGTPTQLLAGPSVIPRKRQFVDGLVWDGLKWKGENIYNRSAYDQRVNSSGPAGSAVNYTMRAQNDLNVAQKLEVRGAAGVGDAQVTYLLNGATDITAQVSGGGWETPANVVAGGWVDVAARVTLAATPAQSQHALYVQVGRAAWGPSNWLQNHDVVKMVTSVDDGASTGTVRVTGLMAVPTSAGAHVQFALSSAAQVEARVLNIAGRPIKTICTASDCEAGANTLIWNAMSDTGLRVPNGIYLVEVTARNEDGGQSKALAQVRIGS